MTNATGPIVIAGGGGHAKVVISTLRKLDFRVIGYTAPHDQGHVIRTRYLGADTVLHDLIATVPDCMAAIGVGKLDASPVRMTLMNGLTALGFDFPVIISPEAVVNEEVALGAGSVVFDGVVVNSGVVAGRACILNTHSTIEHDCRLGHDVHIAPGVTLSGGVTIADHCMIGAGSTVVQGVSIGQGCLIGAGSTVVRDLTEPGVYVGSPVRKIT